MTFVEVCDFSFKNYCVLISLVEVETYNVSTHVNRQNQSDDIS